MTGRLNLAQLRRRVDALEEGRRPAGLLSASEAAELRALDAWFDETFPGPIDAWSDETLEQYFQHARGHDGRAQRYDELRQRDPGRKDADHRRLAEHLGIDPSEVEGYLARAIAELTGAGGAP